MSSFNASLECLESGASFGLSTNRFLSIEERGLQSMKGSFAEPSDGVRDCKATAREDQINFRVNEVHTSTVDYRSTVERL